MLKLLVDCLELQRADWTMLADGRELHLEVLTGKAHCWEQMTATKTCLVHHLELQRVDWMMLVPRTLQMMVGLRLLGSRKGSRMAGLIA